MTASQAIAWAETALADLGLTFVQRGTGATVRTTCVDLIAGGKSVEVGLGKGLGGQSLASALFEAIEHRALAQEALDAEFELAPLELDGRDHFLQHGSPDFGRICGGVSASLSRTTMHGILDPSASIKFPVFLLNPDFAPDDSEERRFLQRYALHRYSTNSGAAAGVTFDEAALHGILELIERDSLSIELLRTVLSAAPRPVRILDPLTFPPSVKGIVDVVAAETSGSITLYDIENEFGVPVTLAALTIDGVRNGCYFGSGASLSPAYSSERAILEAVQSYHYHDLYPSGRPSANRLALRDVPQYMNCWLECGVFRYQGGHISVDFYAQDTNSSTSFASAGIQLREIASRLDRNGHAAYCRSLMDDHVNVVQVAVPSFERFFLVSDGALISPSRRGRTFL